MKYIILDTANKKVVTCPLTADMLAGFDTTGMTVITVADDFTFYLKAINWDNNTVVDDFTPLWNKLRADRDADLAKSDRIMLPDFPITDSERMAWVNYRAALRVLPEQTTDPRSIQWPTVPNEPVI